MIRSSDRDLLGSLREERLPPMPTFIDVAKGWFEYRPRCLGQNRSVRTGNELWQPVEKIRCVLVAPPAQTLAKMQARVLNSCQAFAALKMDPPSFGHAHAYD